MRHNGRGNWVAPVLCLLCGFIFTACAAKRVLVDGTTVTVDLSWWYWTRWGLSILAGLVGLVCAIPIVTANDTESKLLGGVFVTIAAILVWFAWPGSDTPKEVWESANAMAQVQMESALSEAKAHEAQVSEERDKARKKARAKMDASPAGRAKLTRSKGKALTIKRDEQFKPLHQRHMKELKTYKKELSAALPKSGYDSHQALLAAGDASIELRNKLKRAAILRVTSEWLEAKIRSTSVAIAKLDQRAWELERRAELNQVTSADEWKDIETMIATAQAIIEEDTPVAEAQDYAAAEAELFQELSK